MKILRTAISIFLITSFAEAEGVQECPFELGHLAEHIPTSTLRTLLDNFPVEKSQFEKQQQFLDRQSAVLSDYLEPISIFETVIDRDHLEYDSETEVFYFDHWFFSNGTYPPGKELIDPLLGLDDRYAYLFVRGLSHVILDDSNIIGNYIATNSMGASIDVVELDITNVTVFGEHTVVEDTTEIQKIGGMNYMVGRYYGYEPVEIRMAEDISGNLVNQPFYNIPMPIDSAEEFFSSSRTFIATRLELPYILKDTRLYEATLNLPLERHITNYAIRADILCSAVADKNGVVLKIMTPMESYIEIENEM